jgi:hypothetical protein
MNNRLLYYFFLFSILFAKCKPKNIDCSNKIFHFYDEKYEAKGCLYNGIENGEWSITDGKSQILEKGIYDSGIRIGKWFYPQNKSDSIVEWKKFFSARTRLLFNIPILLQKVEEDSNSIKFSNNDSSGLFNLVVATNGLKASNRDIEEYYKQGQEEIEANGWHFTVNRSTIKTSKKNYYLNDYTIITPSGSFKLLNIYTEMSEKGFSEISCRYNENVSASARIIFFSLITNLFYKEERFMNPWEDITYLK